MAETDAAQVADLQSVAQDLKTRGFWSDAFKRMVRNRLSVIGLAILSATCNHCGLRTLPSPPIPTCSRIWTGWPKRRVWTISWEPMIWGGIC